MKTNMKNLNSDDVDLKTSILNLWKEKYIFLAITLIFVFFGYLYSLTQNKNLEFKSKIKLKDPPLEFFSTYEPFFDELAIPFKAKTFKETYNANFFSLNNLENYIEQNNDINNFKDYLKKTKQSSRKFFKPRFQQVTAKVDHKINEVIPGQYYLTYPAILDGSELLDNYAHFIKDLTMLEFKTQKIKQINNIYIVYEQNLEIANAIGLANPLIQNFEGFVQSNILTEPKDSFYQGSVVLEKRMNHLKSIIEKLKEENYYNPISENSIIISSNFKNTNKTIFFALIIGMLFSFFVILFRSILR
tara:strand:- start:4583 stop:5488 length:906 start_codon:yes stop_codon:yes gene_type:complete